MLPRIARLGAVGAAAVSALVSADTSAAVGAAVSVVPLEPQAARPSIITTARSRLRSLVNFFIQNSSLRNFKDRRSEVIRQIYVPQEVFPPETLHILCTIRHSLSNVFCISLDSTKSALFRHVFCAHGRTRNQFHDFSPTFSCFRSPGAAPTGSRHSNGTQPCWENILS